MKPPPSIKVGPFVYRVTVGGKHLRDSIVREPDEKGSESSGRCDNDRLRIMLRDGLAPGAEREVLLHELLHACGNAAGAPWALLGEDHEENAVSILAPPLLGVLRDNPELVAYLLADVA